MRGRSIPSSPHRRRPSGSGPTCTCPTARPWNLETPVPQHRRDGSPPAPHMEPEDTSICLGDVAHPDTWRKRRTLLDLRNCPGRRLLGIGNHDMLNSDHLRKAGFVDQHPAALCATDPPLALTHMPLREPPPGAVNVHGHLHDADAPSARHPATSSARTPLVAVLRIRTALTLDRTTTTRSSGSASGAHTRLTLTKHSLGHRADEIDSGRRATRPTTRTRYLTTSSDAPSAPLPHTC